MVKVQAVEVAAHQRRLQYIALDGSFVGDGASVAELKVKKEGLRELGRAIDKAKLGERMALGPLGAQ